MPQASHQPQTLVTGLVLTLKSREPISDAFRETLSSGCQIELGQQNDMWIPATVVTDWPKKIHGWLESLPEIAAVDVVFVELEAETKREAATA